MASSLKSTLATLPNEALLDIWLRIDDPSAWAATSKRFNALSKDIVWRGKWFMENYQLCDVIFYAIARPRIFDAALLDQLLRLGAPLSRNLVQLVVVMHNSMARRRLVYQSDNRGRSDWLGEGNDTLRWGLISLPSYSAVLRHGARLYGQAISSSPAHLDCCVWADWLEEVEEGSTTKLTEPVRDLFERFNFVPLQLSLQLGWEGYVAVYCRGDSLITAVTYNPLLAVTIVKNGYRFTMRDVGGLIDCWSYTEDEEEILTKIGPALWALRIDGIVYFPESYVRCFLEARAELDSSTAYFTPHELSEDLLNSISPWWSILVRLDKADALPFYLQDVIDDFLHPSTSSEEEGSESSEGAAEDGESSRAKGEQEVAED